VGLGECWRAPLATAAEILPATRIITPTATGTSHIWKTAARTWPPATSMIPMGTRCHRAVRWPAQTRTGFQARNTWLARGFIITCTGFTTRVCRGGQIETRWGSQGLRRLVGD